tara:strand:- start:5570 stop:5935 length:366 start_codon:yes stop_codon:yes gene_type:complete
LKKKPDKGGIPARDKKVKLKIIAKVKLILLKNVNSLIKGDFSIFLKEDKFNKSNETITDKIMYKTEYKQKISTVFINTHKVRNPVCTIPLKANNPHNLSCVIAPKDPINHVNKTTINVKST